MGTRLPLDSPIGGAGERAKVLPIGYMYYIIKSSVFFSGFAIYAIKQFKK